MSEKLKRLGEKLAGCRYVLIAACAGLLLMLWPAGGSGDDASPSEQTAEEARVAAALTEIEGVGQARVLLSETGAVVICPGADSPAVCLRVTQAVGCYTGLGAGEVRIFKSESSWRDEH